MQIGFGIGILLGNFNLSAKWRLIASNVLGHDQNRKACRPIDHRHFVCRTANYADNDVVGEVVGENDLNRRASLLNC
jgi:hypothetical protein